MEQVKVLRCGRLFDGHKMWEPVLQLGCNRYEPAAECVLVVVQGSRILQASVGDNFESVLFPVPHISCFDHFQVGWESGVVVAGPVEVMDLSGYTVMPG